MSGLNFVRRISGQSFVRNIPTGRYSSTTTTKTSCFFPTNTTQNMGKPQYAGVEASFFPIISNTQTHNMRLVMDDQK